MKLDINYIFIPLIFVWTLSFCCATEETDQIFIITRLDIITDVRYRFSETIYTLTVFNPSHDNETYIVDIPFPKEAFISNFTLEVGDEILLSSIIGKDSKDIGTISWNTSESEELTDSMSE
ncbi:uncharacterized protein [Mytilus edulis]|uniref:uncharacterized protein n=1 Tax=Mytilus edulis TaxID=6550 RepID=UPI0039EF0EB0